jgi:capsule polysaccharide export protein KpsC/LpsZ
MVDLLSKLVPDGWKVYVKEHRSQFKRYQSAERSKTVESYDYIAGMPNVELVPLKVSSLELIDHAQATVTVSGTVGWESLVRGKPVLLFGHSWFSACKGVFVAHTVEDCKSAIEAIQNGFQVDSEEIKCFAQVVEQNSYRGYIDPVYEQMGLISPEENAMNLAKAIYEYFA